MEFLKGALKAGDVNNNTEALVQCLCGIATLTEKDSVASMYFSSLIDSFSSEVKNIREMPESNSKNFPSLPSYIPQSALKNIDITNQSTPNKNLANNHSSTSISINDNTISNNSINENETENRFTVGSNRFRSKNIDNTESVPSFQTASAALGISAVKKNKLSKSQISSNNSTFQYTKSQNDRQSSKEVDYEGDERLRNIEPQMIEKIENEILMSTSSTRWSDVAGLESAKQAVIEAIIYPMIHPEVFTGLRTPPRGVLFFGPPGTGKTMIAKALANEAGCTFFNISASSLTSKWVGEGEKLTRALFCVARVRSPSIVFIDEIDSLLTKRGDNDFEASRRVKTEFLLQFQGVSSGDDERILILGATNRPQDLDDAARRRFEKRIYIPLPDAATRKALIELLLKQCPSEITQEQVEEIVKMTEGYSCADINSLFREAAIIPVRINMDIKNLNKKPDVRPMVFNDVMVAARKVKSSVSPESLKQYEEWDKEFGYTSC
ncbi:Fidgetin-like protein 1 [Tritrichomonas foetus]|uniref:Fidgetin-like protein 1 n=1 Tax=Tritrichomonas foetus TaxID=1144522 RepID=A0A1J4K657_9EUKA|nr:Fidgetin-like protein 1 [Tritrichomonas foetus]|eukprot:OHT05174.1 Fidgetin-like protein 1 [Tritrichomonas foetus]